MTSVFLDELKPGMSASMTRTVTEQHVQLFGEATGDIAVQRAVPRRHLRFIAGGEHDWTKLVGDGHQDVAANTCLQVFRRQAPARYRQC